MKNKLLGLTFILGALAISSAQAIETKTVTVTSTTKVSDVKRGKVVSSETLKYKMSAEKFNHMDYNKDGLVSKCEAKKFLKMEFSRLDKNRDGVLSERELYWKMDDKECLSKKLNPDMKNPDMEMSKSLFDILPPRSPFFAKLDNNNNGTISRGEFVKDGMKSFKIMDVNDDKKVSLEEFQSKPSMKVKSYQTDLKK